MKCWFCNAEVPPGKQRCPSCKVEIPADPPEVKCPKCGRILTDRDSSGRLYCKQCGLFAPNPGSVPSSPADNQSRNSFCAQCGSPIPPSAKFCAKCGSRAGAVISENTSTVHLEKKAKANVKKGCLLIMVGAFILGFLVLIISVSTCSKALKSIDNPPGLSLENHRLVRGEYGVKFVAGTISNSGSKNYEYAQVEINLYDRSGNLIGSTLANVNNLGPGQRWKFEAPVIQDDISKYEIKGITAF